MDGEKKRSDSKSKEAHCVVCIGREGHRDVIIKDCFGGF